MVYLFTLKKWRFEKIYCPRAKLLNRANRTKRHGGDHRTALADGRKNAQILFGGWGLFLARSTA